MIYGSESSTLGSNPILQALTAEHKTISQENFLSAQETIRSETIKQL